MEKKLIVALLFGGRSAEHEISIRSAGNIARALDQSRYQPLLIGIERTGEWYLHDRELFSGPETAAPVLERISAKERLNLLPGDNRRQPVLFTAAGRPLAIDVVFPVLHGTYGEDGTIQGLLKLLNIPFVGAGVAGSLVGMDKDLMKRLLRDSGIPVGKFLVFHKKDKIDFQQVKTELGLPFFIKPCNMGSSVGISKVSGEAEFTGGLHEAFLYDSKIVIEEAIAGREVECSLLGNHRPEASLPGEIITTDTFYSYKAKYLDESTTRLQMPADLPPAVTRELQTIAIRSYQALCCSGMARLDCFVTPDGKVIINEINTIPGFTSISMYPKLWELAGLKAPALINRLLELALEQFAEEQELKTSYF